MHVCTYMYMYVCTFPFVTKVHTYMYIYVHVNIFMNIPFAYGVATISRIDQITGLFCKRALEKRGYSAIENYDFKEPTNRSHPVLWTRRIH